MVLGLPVPVGRLGARCLCKAVRFAEKTESALHAAAMFVRFEVLRGRDCRESFPEELCKRKSFVGRRGDGKAEENGEGVHRKQAV